MLEPRSLLVMVTGRDRAGVTAAFFVALAAHDVDVRDVEQVTVHGRLILAVVLELRGEIGPLRHVVAQTAAALGMDSEVTLAEPAVRLEAHLAERASRSHVILLGRTVRPGAIGHVAQRIADVGGNIESVIRLASHPAVALELMVSSASPDALRAVLVRAADDTGLDIAVEAAGLQRRAKRLVVLDVDSTLVDGEGVDLLAERAGVGAEVAEITARAMAGELDFEQALRARVERLAGLPLADVHAVRDALRLTPGARTFVRTLTRLGYHVGVVSGGFTVFTDRFVAELGLDFAAANSLEIEDDRVTGRVLGDIVDRAGKAAAVRRFADEFGVSMSQTVAVGDGANDIDMIEAAGLGIAFNAKAALRASADGAVNLPYLDSVLFMLGISHEEIEQAGALESV